MDSSRAQLVFVAVSVAGPAILFMLAELAARYAVVYRRNNLAAALATGLFVGGTYLWGWLGLTAFALGTAVGAWSWLAAIARANDRFKAASPQSR